MFAACLLPDPFLVCSHEVRQVRRRLHRRAVLCLCVVEPVLVHPCVGKIALDTPGCKRSDCGLCSVHALRFYMQFAPTIGLYVVAPSPGGWRALDRGLVWQSSRSGLAIGLGIRIRLGKNNKMPTPHPSKNVACSVVRGGGESS